MTGLILYFFFAVFFVGFARFVLELLIPPRNEFLFKLSIGMMGVSVFVYALLITLHNLEDRYRVSFLSQTSAFLIFFAGIVFCAWVGFLWLKRLK
jgi:hypothetical protein